MNFKALIFNDLSLALYHFYSSKGNFTPLSIFGIFESSRLGNFQSFLNVVFKTPLSIISELIHRPIFSVRLSLPC
jgi:hypothetical protein